MQTSIITMDDIKQQLKETMKHSFLDQRVDIPAINSEKLFILLSILNHTTLPDPIKTRYILTVMLIQTALDAHDTIPVNNWSSERPFTEEDQLTILAGDYYSGLYYYILSEINDYSMVRELAEAIKDINESKMALYYGTTETFDDYIHRIKHIETLLLTRVARYVGVEGIANFAQDWVLIDKLMKTRDNKQQKDISFCPSNGSTNQQNRQYDWPITALDNFIDQGIEHLTKELHYRLKPSIIAHQSGSMFYHFLNGLSTSKEEG